MKTKASKVQPVWADTEMNRWRIQEMLAEGKTVTEIGREFGISRSRIAPLVKAVRESDVIIHKIGANDSAVKMMDQWRREEKEAEGRSP